MDTGGERYEGDIIFATRQPNSRSLEIPRMIFGCKADKNYSEARGITKRMQNFKTAGA